MSTRDQILAAYSDLVTRPGGSVSLADLRARLGSIGRDELDHALIEMDDDRVIQLEPDPDQAAFTPEYRAAAIRMCGRDLHLIREVLR